jgi:hypothetical protein
VIDEINEAMRPEWPDREEPAMRYWRILAAGTLSLAVIGLAPPSAPVRAETDGKGFVRTRPEQVEWKNGLAVVEGDPSKPGIYVMRVKFEPHTFSMPHWHNADRHIVVLKGTWYMGVGEKFDPSAAVPMPVGSYVKHPAGAHTGTARKTRKSCCRSSARGRSRPIS